MNKKKKCFVIMPVSKSKSCTEDEWTGIFEHIIKPAVTGSKLGFECERAKPLTGAFVKDILERLNSADIVIADLTDRNPNVCYELGIRHTLQNRTILIAQRLNDVPSDLRSYWVITYKKDLNGIASFKEKVRELLREMQKNPEKTDSPVADFLQLKNIDILAYEKSANLRKLDALLSEMSANLDMIDPILASCKNNQTARKHKKPTSIRARLFENSCLQLLVTSRYVLLSEPSTKAVALLSSGLIWANALMDLWSQPAVSDSAERVLIELLSIMKDQLGRVMVLISRVRLDYQNNNYHEPKESVIVLATPEHERYIKLTK